MGKRMRSKMGAIGVEVRDEATGAMDLRCPGWEGFRLENLRPAVRCDGAALEVSACTSQQAGVRGTMVLQYAFGGVVSLTLKFVTGPDGGTRVRSSLRNVSGREIVLNDVALFSGQSDKGSLGFGVNPQAVQVFEQGSYWARVRPLVRAEAEGKTASAGEPNTAAERLDSTTDFVWAVYDRASRMALVVGFVTSQRWIGRIQLAATASGHILSWRVGFDGGDLLIKPGQEVELEELVLACGGDPLALLEWYGDAVARRHRPEVPDRPPVSWCSWYPYRLALTEDHVLQNARVAARRLKPLGFEIVEADLGWETGNLPSAFDENERFPHGLKWLADELRKLGLSLGVWKAPFTISEFDPVSQEHPEWLICGDDGKPVAYWEWYWEPHGKVFILDLTQPPALAWLKQKVSGLQRKGVRYFKADFIGCAMSELAKRRRDRTIVSGGGCEAARLGLRAIREALPGALLLNCGAPEMPGTGHWPLAYVCNDTGNTGFINHKFQQENHLTVACHLFKNRRWAIIQPSCLCVGLPGTLEDARLRATVAFLAGGQIDVSDDLTTLPEDRWSVLTACLPPLGVSARAIDLFEPVCDEGPFDYTAICKGDRSGASTRKEHPPGSVWHLHVDAGWDEWDLVGVFSYAPGAACDSPQISRFCIPFERLGIAAGQRQGSPNASYRVWGPRWGYEFWSGQFIGTLPGGRVNLGGYQHPGDFQELKTGSAPGVLDIAFFGPGAKLLCLRKPRPHPWVVGTSFHLSCGAELKEVAWNKRSATLSGVVHRSAGESGFVVITADGMTPTAQQVDGRAVSVRLGAGGSVILPVALKGSSARWSVKFKKAPRA